MMRRALSLTPSRAFLLHTRFASSSSSSSSSTTTTTSTSNSPLDTLAAEYMSQSWLHMDEFLQADVRAAVAKTPASDPRAAALKAALEASEAVEGIYERVYETELTLGDKLGSMGDNVQQAPELMARVETLMDEYRRLMDLVKADPMLRHKVQRELGHSMLQLKAMVHDPAYRYRLNDEFRT